MHRYRLTIEYDGRPFVGWQVQDNGPSVQGALVAAIEAMTGERVKVQGAGRTDAGVHALGQVAHIDLERDWASDTIRDGLNHHLKPAPVAVVAASRTHGEFHARFSATARHYHYRILNRRAPPVLDAGRVWQVPRPLDIAAMNAAAATLVGHHDFTTFRSVHCQADSPVRTLDRLEVSRAGDLVEIRASARSFLHNQVRSMAGTLKLVGEGLWGPEDVAGALAARDRKACGPVAPPEGLYLVRVDYE